MGGICCKSPTTVEISETAYIQLQTQLDQCIEKTNQLSLLNDLLIPPEPLIPITGSQHLNHLWTHRVPAHVHGSSLAPSSPLKIASWNIKFLGSYDKNMEVMREIIQQSNWDVLFVQEVVSVGDTPNAYSSTMASFIQSVIPMYRISFSPHKTGSRPGFCYDNKSTSGEGYAMIYNPLKIDENEGLGRGFLHHQSWTKNSLDAYPGTRVPFMFSCRVPKGHESISFYVITVHFDPDSPPIRIKETLYLLTIMQSWPFHKDPHCRVMIVGDMNFQHQQEVNQHALLWACSGWELTKGFGSTNVHAQVLKPYDHMIYYSKNMTLTNAKCIQPCDMKDISDHYPIEADVWLEGVHLTTPSPVSSPMNGDLPTDRIDMKVLEKQRMILLDEKQEESGSSLELPTSNEKRDYYTTNINIGIYHLYSKCGTFEYVIETRKSFKITIDILPLTSVRLCKKCIRRKI